MIHFARAAKSKRLRDTLKMIRGRGATNWVIKGETGSCAVHTDIAELRAQGYNIPPAKYEGLSMGGRKIYRYKVIR